MSASDSILLLQSDLKRYGLSNRVGGVEGAADQRTAFDVAEAHPVAEDFEFGEFGGRDVANHGQVLGVEAAE